MPLITTSFSIFYLSKIKELTNRNASPFFLTAAKQIRKQAKFQYLPIIAMTAHARAEDKAQSLAAGMNLHMSKPVTGKALFDSIKQVLVKA